MISVIVPTLNGARWIGTQLEALANQDVPGEWELVVADNGSTDDTRAAVESWRHRFGRFRLLDASAVRGQSHARNQAALEASGDILLFTDHDDIVCPGWIASLTDGLADASIVTGPVAHFIDGRPPSGANVQEPQRRLRVGAFTHPMGCNMGVVRDVFLRLGSFDETITLGWEDIDFGIRAGLHGVATAWVDEAVVLHRRPNSVRAMWNKEFAYGRGWTMLERRYPQVCSNGWVRPLLRRAGWVAIRAPYVALPSRRRGWVVRAASLAGRVAERLRRSS
jgi:glycosyltransferase involved in cell wall biosynthesis